MAFICSHFFVPSTITVNYIYVLILRELDYQFGVDYRLVKTIIPDEFFNFYLIEVADMI